MVTIARLKTVAALTAAALAVQMLQQTARGSSLVPLLSRSHTQSAASTVQGAAASARSVTIVLQLEQVPFLLLSTQV